MNERQLSRADFLKLIATGAAGAAFLPGDHGLLAPFLDEGEAGAMRAYPYISVAKGHSLTTTHIAAITRTALRNLGGMGRFVHANDWVVIKPNIYGNRKPAQACTTNPTVVATIVRECFRAGARKVTVMDNPCAGGAAASYKASGIYDAARRAGGTVVYMTNPARFRTYAIGNGRSIKSWRIHEDIMKCDVLIDVPIAKVHGNTRVTLGCKNLMGCCDRMNDLHFAGTAFSQNIADLLSRIRPELTVVDAIRVRVADGPGGTHLDDVRKRYMVIASADTVAADSYASRYLLNLAGSKIAHLNNAARMRLGKVNLAGLTIKKVTL